MLTVAMNSPVAEPTMHELEPGHIIAQPPKSWTDIIAAARALGVI
jgi:hypothetical protein